MKIEDARALIAPYEGRIVEAVRAAEEKFVALLATGMPWLTTRSRSSALRDACLSELRRIFYDDGTVDFISLRGMVVMSLNGGKGVFRVKKLDRRLRSSNIPTRQVRHFLSHLPLSGMPPTAERFQIGYQLDSTGTEIMKLWITRPAGLRMSPTYSWPIEQWNQGVQPTLFTAVVSNMPQSEPIVPPIHVKPEIVRQRDADATSKIDASAPAS